MEEQIKTLLLQRQVIDLEIEALSLEHELSSAILAVKTLDIKVSEINQFKKAITENIQKLITISNRIVTYNATVLSMLSTSVDIVPLERRLKILEKTVTFFSLKNEFNTLFLEKIIAAKEFIYAPIVAHQNQNPAPPATTTPIDPQPLQKNAQNKENKRKRKERGEKPHVPTFFPLQRVFLTNMPPEEAKISTRLPPSGENSLLEPTNSAPFTPSKK